MLFFLNRVINLCQVYNKKFFIWTRCFPSTNIYTIKQDKKVEDFLKL